MTKSETTAPPKDIAALSFEAALAELETIVKRLEAGEVELEKSIEIYTRGTALKRHCEAKLKSAQARIEQIRIAASGEAEATPFDVE